MSCHVHLDIIRIQYTVVFRFTHFACQNLYYDCSQYWMGMGNEESNGELDDVESDVSDEEELNDDESDKSDQEDLLDDESDGDETDVEDDSSQLVKFSDPRFSPGRILRRIKRIGRRVVPKFRIRPLKRKIRRHRYGVYPKYGIIRFLRKLRRKGRYYRVKQRQIRKAHRKVKKLGKKIRLLQRKIRRVGRPKMPQRHIRFF